MVVVRLRTCVRGRSSSPSENGGPVLLIARTPRQTLYEPTSEKQSSALVLASAMKYIYIPTTSRNWFGRRAVSTVWIGAVTGGPLEIRHYLSRLSSKMHDAPSAWLESKELRKREGSAARLFPPQTSFRLMTWLGPAVTA